MQNLIEVVGLQPYLEDLGIDYKDRDFEGVYSELHGLARAQDTLHVIEQRVAEYFGSLELHDTLTLYDHLVLSLREKDVIATFNWDPFLFTAASRNYRIAKPPHLLFLHGNVAVGFCLRDKSKGAVGTKCSKCGRSFIRSKLLFPIRQKNYTSDPYISSEWETLKQVLAHAYVFTIFGYSAPTALCSDIGPFLVAAHRCFFRRVVREDKDAIKRAIPKSGSPSPTSLQPAISQMLKQ